MFSPSLYGDLTQMFGYCLNYIDVKFFINVKHFIVINVPIYCILLSVYDAVCYVFIIWMDSEPVGFQILMYSLYHNNTDSMNPYIAFNNRRCITLTSFYIQKFFFCYWFTTHMMSNNPP